MIIKIDDVIAAAKLETKEPSKTGEGEEGEEAGGGKTEFD